jgi:hypothetical protein
VGLPYSCPGSRTVLVHVSGIAVFRPASVTGPSPVWRRSTQNSAG